MMHLMRIIGVFLTAMHFSTLASAEGGPQREPDSYKQENFDAVGENNSNVRLFDTEKLDEKNLEVPGYVFGVTVRSAQQLDVILERANSLRELFNPEQHSRIAIVLHGEELRLFQKDNYSTNQSIVEKARLLDQAEIIDIKACQTMMRDLDIQQSELPTFIEQVPLGPAEIDRLTRQEDYTRL